MFTFFDYRKVGASSQSGLRTNVFVNNTNIEIDFFYKMIGGKFFQRERKKCRDEKGKKYKTHNTAVVQ